MRKRPFLARGLGLDGIWLPVPRQEFVEAAGGMTVGHALQDVSEPRKGLDVVELCGGNEGADGCPSDAAAVRAREQMVFAPERHCPFILPMSGRSWKSTTGIIHISAARSWCVAWSSERRANFLACKGRQASWYRSPVGCSIL